MKTNYFLYGKFTIYSLLGFMALATVSCGSSQNTSYEPDGIYDDSQKQKSTTQSNSQGVQYKHYFNSLQNDNPEIFTDVNNYSTPYIDSTGTQQGYAGGNAGWGEEADNVSVNVYAGWGYDYWYQPYWGFGWSSWYGPSWGIGWGWYGPGWGYYPPYYGYYGGSSYYGYYGGHGHSYYGGHSHYTDHSYTYNGSRRNYNSTNARGNQSVRNYANNGGSSRSYTQMSSPRSYTSSVGTRTPRGTRSSMNTAPRSSSQTYSAPRSSSSPRSYSPNTGTRSGGYSSGGGGYSGGGGGYSGGGGGRGGGGGGGGRR